MKIYKCFNNKINNFILDVIIIYLMIEEINKKLKTKKK
jgi:hypothetical protein